MITIKRAVLNILLDFERGWVNDNVDSSFEGCEWFKIIMKVRFVVRWVNDNVDGSFEGREWFKIIMIRIKESEIGGRKTRLII